MELLTWHRDPSPAYEWSADADNECVRVGVALGDTIGPKSFGIRQQSGLRLVDTQHSCQVPCMYNAEVGYNW
jgi:hypothetical protein